MQTPPPLPQPSSKRILPAFLLCFTLGAHRIYAGKIITGILQMGCAYGAAYWLYMTWKDLIAQIQNTLKSPHDGLEILSQVAEWRDTHAMPVIPMFLLLAAGLWIAIDAGKLIAGKFTDAQGNKITHWL